MERLCACRPRRRSRTGWNERWNRRRGRGGRRRGWDRRGRRRRQRRRRRWRGVNTGAAGYGENGEAVGNSGGFGGRFPNGGARSMDGGPGGFGGGGSYLASLFADQVLTAGVNSGDGSISIDLLPPAVPEASTWAMMLAGFAGLGWLAHTRRRKASPA
jgi:hypothetical protein